MTHRRRTTDTYIIVVFVVIVVIHIVFADVGAGVVTAVVGGFELLVASY